MAQRAKGKDPERGRPPRASPSRAARADAGMAAGAAADDLGARLAEYTEALFALEDDLLRQIRREVVRRGWAHMQVSPAEGKLLQVLCVLVGARRVIEVGTLLGYSAIWMGRALPPDGELHTLEIDEARVRRAREFIGRAGLSGVIRVHVGAAPDLLAAFGPGASFDAMFIDADKENYPAYLDEATRLLRPGGILLADNAYWSGRVLDVGPQEAGTRAIREFNRRLAADPRYASTIIPVRDGLALGVRSAG